MTRDQFVKKKFQAYQVIMWVNPTTKVKVECMLVGIHFDRELLTLDPVDKVLYHDEEFLSHIKDCYLP